MISIVFCLQFYEQDLSRLGQPVPAPPSPESEYVPAVDSVVDDSEGGHYEQDDDWRPKVRICDFCCFLLSLCNDVKMCRVLF